MQDVLIIFALIAMILIGLALMRPKSEIVDVFRGPKNETPGIHRDVLAVNSGNCPDCRKHDVLLCGPSGGMSTNICCNNCLMEFNVHMGFGTGALSVDRTGRASESRAAVFGIQQEEYRTIERELYNGDR